MTLPGCAQCSAHRWEVATEPAESRRNGNSPVAVPLGSPGGSRDKLRDFSARGPGVRFCMSRVFLGLRAGGEHHDNMRAAENPHRETGSDHCSYRVTSRAWISGVMPWGK